MRARRWSLLAAIELAPVEQRAGPPCTKRTLPVCPFLGLTLPVFRDGRAQFRASSTTAAQIPSGAMAEAKAPGYDFRTTGAQR